MIRFLIIYSIVVFASSPAARSATYHIDSLSGNDASPGTTPEQAWRSLDKVNSTKLKPSDKVLFKAGCRWAGQLKPTGSGDNDSLVTIGRYGEGSLPRIDGEGKFLDAVLLENFSFIEIADLEITNQGASRVPWRTGVKISADGIGKMQRIYLRRLFVHDVNGDLRKSDEGCGIFFEATLKNDSHFDGLLIEKCHVLNTDRNGICQRGYGKVRSRNVIIRENLLEDIGGDGIKLWGTDGGLIEKNVVRKARARCDDAAVAIWTFAGDDTVIQFNEVSDTVGIVDGQAFDCDYACRRTIIQYNYSFHNEGGFLLVCSPGNSYCDSSVIRYNVSVHDGINSARTFQFGGGTTKTQVYNNTIVIGPDQNLPLLSFNEWDGGNPKDTNFSNNLFIVEEGGLATFKFGPSSGNVFENNLFCGRHEGLPAGVTLSPTPKFVGPLKPAPGFESVKGFRPAPGQDLPSGRVIQNNGGRDFFGNPVSRDKAPAIGAMEPLR
jgi:hypothetical protein